MNSNTNEKQFKDIIDVLKHLPKVGAPDYFDSNIFRKVISEKFEDKNGFWEKFLLPSRLIPSAVLAAVAIAIVFIVNLNFYKTDDPLSSEPKVREDVIATSGSNSIVSKEKNDVYNSAQNADPYRSLKNESASGNYALPAQRNFSFAIDKQGLNFRHVTMNPDERLKIDRLKQKMLLNYYRNN